MYPPEWTLNPIKSEDKFWGQGKWLLGLPLIVYVGFAVWFPLRPFLAQIPQPDIFTFTPSLALGIFYGLLLIGLFGWLWLAFTRTWQGRWQFSLRIILVTAVFYILPLVFTYPINATDVYRYVIRGRITSQYHANPFVTPPAHFADDPLLPLAGEWATATSPYGPVWELLAGGITAVFPQSLYTNLLLFKLLGATLHLLITIIIWHSLPSNRAKIAHTLLWAWNPAGLLIFVTDAHNDALMLFWLLLAWWLLKQKRHQTGLLIAWLAPLTKPIGLLALPFFFLYVGREQTTWKQRLQVWGTAVFAGATLTLLAFIPFGSPLALAQRLLQEASASAGFSWATLIILLGRQIRFAPSFAILSRVGQSLLGIIALWLAWHTWNGRSPLRAIADIFLAYIWQAFNFRLWYTIWPFAWLLLDSPHTPHATFRLHVGLWQLLTAQLSVLIYQHMRLFLFQGNQLAAHLIGVPFTLLLPLVLAWWTQNHLHPHSHSPEHTPHSGMPQTEIHVHSHTPTSEIP